MSKTKPPKTRMMNVPTELYDHIQKIRHEGESLNDCLARYIKERVEQQTAVSLFAAADRIVQEMSEAKQELIADLCKDRRCHNADFVMSWIKYVEDVDKLTYLLPEGMRYSEQKDLPNVAMPQKPGVFKKVCEFCQKEFETERGDQRYCPAPEDEALPSCGKKAHILLMRQLRPRQADPRDYDPEALRFAENAKTQNELRMAYNAEMASVNQ